MRGIAATSLAYEQDWNRDKFEIDLPLSLPFQQASAAAYTCKIGRDLERTCSRISVHYYETSYDTCRGTNIVWPLIGSKFAKNGWKLGKVGKTRCTWPFQANNRYDVRLANRRAPGVWFVLLQNVPVFGTKVTRYICFLHNPWIKLHFLDRSFLTAKQ